MQEQVAQLLPTREGHFVFESGHHGQVWLDLQLLLLHPERFQPLAEALADRLRGYHAAAVCGPLVEGAFVGLMVASSLRLPFTYSEPGAGPPCGRPVFGLISDPKAPGARASGQTRRDRQRRHQRRFGSSRHTRRAEAVRCAAGCYRNTRGVRPCSSRTGGNTWCCP